MPAQVAASILSADFAALGDAIRSVEPYAGSLHVDAMDGHFVPVLSIGPVVVESIRPRTRLPVSCHLMVSRPERLFPAFAEAGADLVTCHVEAVPDPRSTVAEARRHGLGAGLAVNPETPVEGLFPLLDELDNVLVMSVHPGWAGQDFLEEALPKIEAVAREIDRRGLPTTVEVDGGINESTAPRCLAAGATIIAAASSIFKAPDPGDAARRLAELAQTAEGAPVG